MSEFLKMLNKLNCMNYHVSTNDGQGDFYLQDGIRSLYRLSKHNKVDFKSILKGQVKEGQSVSMVNGNPMIVTMI